MREKVHTVGHPASKKSKENSSFWIEKKKKIAAEITLSVINFKDSILLRIERNSSRSFSDPFFQRHFSISSSCNESLNITFSSSNVLQINFRCNLQLRWMLTDCNFPLQNDASVLLQIIQKLYQTVQSVPRPTVLYVAWIHMSFDLLKYSTPIQVDFVSLPNQRQMFDFFEIELCFLFVFSSTDHTIPSKLQSYSEIGWNCRVQFFFNSIIYVKNTNYSIVCGQNDHINVLILIKTTKCI